MIIFSLPFTPAAVPGNEDFSWEAFNYAPVAVITVIVFAAILWAVSGNKTFHSPAEEDAAVLAAEIGRAAEVPRGTVGLRTRVRPARLAAGRTIALRPNGMTLGPLAHCGA